MPSPYATLLDATRDTLTERAARYRTLVVIVALDALITPAAAWALGNPHWLSLWALLPAVVLTFVALDWHAVDHLRAQALTPWSQGTLRLDLLASTVRQAPGLPSATVGGMLDSLPGWTDAAMPPEVRQPLADLQARIGRCATRVLALRAAIVWGAGLAGMAALLVSPWALALWLALALAAMGLHRQVAASLRTDAARCWHAVASVAGNRDDAAGWFGQLNLQGLPSRTVAIVRATPLPA